MVTLQDIQDALRTIAPLVHRTPLVHSNSFSLMSGADVFLKTENLQKTGSFKVRGACNKLARIAEGGVVAASMGNHAQGVAFAAARFGRQATVVMPKTASLIKQEATRGYGATVLLHGESFADALAYARTLPDLRFIHAFDDDEIIAGQGTVGLEILDGLDGIDTILVPVGGGGLIAGIAAAVKERAPGVRVIGVQTKAAISGLSSFKNGVLTESSPAPTIADGIAVSRIGERPFALIKRFVDDIVAVDEEAIAMAVLLFMERKKLVVEGAGAVALAALLNGVDTFRGKRVVLVVSGGNIDFTLIDRIVRKGLVTGGRIGIFEVVLDDLPGRLHAVTGVIAEHQGNVLDVVHERFAAGLPVGRTRVLFTVETRGRDHLDAIIRGLRAGGFEAESRPD